jgi:hypothetical protein
MRYLRHLILVGFLVVNSCAQSAQPIAVHMQADSMHGEHDEVISKDTIIDFYPDRQNPTEVMLRKTNQQGMLDATCLDAPTCHQLSIKILGSKMIPDGAYQFLQTSNSHLVMVRDGSGEHTLGYLAQNNGGGGYQYFSSLQEAQSFEHSGDAMRTTAKVAGGVLLAAGLIALVAAAGVAAANANKVTTSCHTFGNDTTCTSR